MTNMTKQQIAITEAVANTIRSLNVEAVPGSGKTTTLVEVAKALSQSELNLAIAHNKHIAEELTKRLPYYTKSSTFHSWCNAMLQGFKRCKVDPKKVYALCKTHKLKPKYSFALSWAKGQITTGSGITPDIVKQACLSFDLDAHKFEQLAQADADAASIDFDDMLWRVLRLDKLPPVHNLLIDEAQDLSPVQHAIIKRVAPRRLFLFGDPRQSIYGFRGAVCEGQQSLARDFDCVNLPLSCSFRLPLTIADEANKIYPCIDTKPDALVGRVSSVDYNDIDIRTLSGAVLCRNNAPLFSLAVRLIQARIPCVVRGRDLLQQLTRAVKTFETDNLVVEVSLWLTRETERWERLGFNPRSLHDLAACLVALAPVAKTKEMLLGVLDAIFDERDPQVTLSSIHRSKGLEWNKVFLLYPELIPSKWAETDEELEQEQNLRFVAVTRAQQELTYITGGALLVED